MATEAYKNYVADPQIHHFIDQKPGKVVGEGGTTGPLEFKGQLLQEE